MYTEPAGGWATTSAFTAELTASDGDTVDNLGDSVAVSGTTIVAGAPRHDAESSTADYGAAYVFGPGSIVVPPRSSSPPVVVPPPPAQPTVKLGSISGGHAKITAALSCPEGSLACARVTLKATVKEHRKGRKIIAITAGKKQEDAHDDEDGRGRERRRDAGGRHEEDTDAHDQFDWASTTREVRQAQGDRDHQLWRQDNQDGHRHRVKGRKAEKEEEK